MSMAEVDRLLKKIKSFYQYFEINEEKTKDWYVVLRNYEFNDIVTNLNKHVAKFENSTIMPTVGLLLEGLKSHKKVVLENCDVYCPYCQKYVMLTKYDNHIDKCSSINYFLNEYERISNKKYSREKLEQLADEKFKAQYETLLNFVKNNPLYEKQEKVIDKILGLENNLTVDEIIKTVV